MTWPPPVSVLSFWCFLLLSTAHMRAAAIFGLGCSPKHLDPFRIDNSIDWRIGMPPAADEADVILIFGGDGTIHRHLNQLVKLGLPLLVVPAGSGNDFASALGLARVRDSLVAWRRFYARQDNVSGIDLGVVTPLAVAGGAPAPHGCYFCSVAGVGLDAEVSRRAQALPRWLRAHGGYALTLAPTIFRFASVPVKKLAPRARLDDGQLDVCVIAGVNPFKLFYMFPTVYFGRHLTIRGVESFQAARLRVETQTSLDIYADGEFVCQTPVELSLHPRALKVLTPRPQC